MPRTGRGGSRVGKPGTAYANRTDLNAQPVRTATGQAYGKAGEQAAQQTAIPIPQTPGIPPPQPQTPGQQPPSVPTGGLYDPSTRPDEPVHAGLGQPGVDPISPADILRRIYAMYPNDDIRRALAQMQ